MRDEYARYINLAIAFRYRGMEIPVRLRDGLARYLARRERVGDFLQAVIANDLMRACAKADDLNLGHLAAVVAFLHNEAPFSAWGTADRYRAWVAGAVPDARLHEQKNIEENGGIGYPRDRMANPGPAYRPNSLAGEQ